MKIALASVGSRGDIQPYIAFAKALNDAGHETFLATLPWAKEIVESYGVRHVAVGQQVDLNKGVASIMDDSGSNRKGLFASINFIFDTLRACHKDYLEVFHEADLVIGHGVVGISEAEMLEKPFIISSIEPMGLPKLSPRTGTMVTDFFASIPDRLMMALFGGPYNRFRRDVGAPPFDPEREGKHPYLAILPVSAKVMKAMKRWKPRTEIIGYFYADTPISYVPDDALKTFLESEGEHVFFSTGSMQHTAQYRTELTELVAEASNLAGVKTLLLLDGIGRDNLQTRENLLCVDSVPYPYVLPKLDLVVHHFGFGTTAEVLKAGLPSVPVPHIFDQRMRAQQLYKAGLCAKPLNMKKTTSAKLGKVLRAALDDETMRNKAKETAAFIATEGGLKRGVELVEEVFRLR